MRVFGRFYGLCSARTRHCSSFEECDSVSLECEGLLRCALKMNYRTFWSRTYFVGPLHAISEKRCLSSWLQ